MRRASGDMNALVHAPDELSAVGRWHDRWLGAMEYQTSGLAFGARLPRRVARSQYAFSDFSNAKGVAIRMDMSSITDQFSI